jgi:hypothetical protein
LEIRTKRKRRKGTEASSSSLRYVLNETSKINRSFSVFSPFVSVISLVFSIPSLLFSDLRLVIAYGFELQEEEEKRSMMRFFAEKPLRTRCEKKLERIFELNGFDYVLVIFMLNLCNC